MVFAVLNQKGGTGKTTTSVNVAAALAKDGQRVLLLDNDPQGHIGRSLGLSDGEGTDVLYADPSAELADVVQHGRENLDVILCDDRLSNAARQADSDRANGLFRLADRWEDMQDYDCVMVDCPPTLELLTLNAIVLINEAVSKGAEGGIVVPVSMDPLAVSGIGRLRKTVQRFRERMPHIGIHAVVPTFVDVRNKRTEEVMSALEGAFDGQITAGVRISTRLSEAPGKGQTIFEYDPEGRGATDYMNVANDLYHGE